MSTPLVSKENMASKIKKFFKSKKNEAKFKLGMAGPGHRLGEASSSQQSSGKSQGAKPVAHRVAPSSEAQQAAAAALARLQRPDKDKPAFNTYVFSMLFFPPQCNELNTL